MSAILDELFVRQTGETTCEIAEYSDRLDRVVESCPEANVVRESQQWSRLAAYQCPDGAAAIYDADKFDGDELPFNPQETSQWVAYCWDRENDCWDLAWVAVWEQE